MSDDEDEESPFLAGARTIRVLLDHLDSCRRCVRDETGGTTLCPKGVELRRGARRVAAVLDPYLKSKNN